MGRRLRHRRRLLKSSGPPVEPLRVVRQLRRTGRDAAAAAPSPTWYERRGKRALDLAGAVALLIALWPVLAGVAVAVRVVLGAPVLFHQARVGRGGEAFTLYKFRTMKTDRRVRAERRAQDRARDRAGDRRQTHKSTADPRHTPLGRFLRRSSLDELPQLWNVVRGDMSLVGPRPELTEVVDRYSLRDHPRHRVRPGLTGPWQISARGNGLLHEHVDVDLAYVARITLLGDLAILLATPAAVLRRTGS